MQERRLSPRYLIDWPATLRRRDAATFAASACDISAAGVGLQVPREAVQALAQGGSILTPGDHLELLLRGGDAAAGSALEGRVQHVRRLSRDRYLVALRFEETDPRQAAALGALLEQAKACHLRA